MRIIRNKINEKYALQEYEGRIRDAIIDEIKELNRASILIWLFLRKFKSFRVNRKIRDEELNCSLSLIYYDRESKDSIRNKVSDDIDAEISPDEVDGVTAHDKVVIYVPIERAPFESKALNNELEYLDSKEVKRCLNGLRKSDDIIEVENYNSIKEKINDLVERYRSNIDSIFYLLEKEGIEGSESKKKSLGINISYVLKTINHEFTHVLDQDSASGINHFSGLGIDEDDVDIIGLDLALNILYSLWSRTEFNAFTQTFGRDVEKQREIVRSSYINKVSLHFLNRKCADGGSVDLKEFIENLHEDIRELSDPDYDESFWESIRNIVIEGSRENSARERFENMSSTKFRNYFINTSVKLIEKLEKQVVKNIAAQNTYDRDISNISAEIFDACNEVIREYSKNDSTVEMEFNFNCYFKKLIESHKVYVEIEVPNIEKKYLNNDNTIASQMMIHITIGDLNIGYDLSADEAFGTSNCNIVKLFRELMTSKKKTDIKRLCINTAEDFYRLLNKFSLK